jgi:hypothetical protein
MKVSRWVHQFDSGLLRFTKHLVFLILLDALLFSLLLWSYLTDVIDLCMNVEEQLTHQHQHHHQCWLRGSLGVFAACVRFEGISSVWLRIAKFFPSWTWHFSTVVTLLDWCDIVFAFRRTVDWYVRLCNMQKNSIATFYMYSMQKFENISWLILIIL